MQAYQGILGSILSNLLSYRINFSLKAPQNWVTALGALTPKNLLRCSL